MAIGPYIPDPEELGRKRFPDNQSYRANLYGRASEILATLIDLLPSNYPKDTNTNVAILLNVLAREFSRIHYSNDAINNDKVYTQTRIEYLQQILGERLFLKEQIAPENYSDESFRNYLISLKDAYLIGSKKDNIESTAEKFTGIDINIRELYLEARKPNSAYSVVDTNKMVVDVFVDDLLNSGKNINDILTNLNFFINLIRPAHVLYDTRLIWTDQIDVNKVHDLIYGDTGGGCVPVYDYIPLGEPTYLARQVSVLTSSQGATGRIDSLHNDYLTLFLTDGTRVITEPGVNGTVIFNSLGKRIRFDQLRIGQWVKISWLQIPGDFQFWYLPPDVLPSSVSRFYLDTIRKPAFQEFVKKVMDPQGRFPLQIKTTPTTICDRWVQDLLQPYYEDLRKDCDATSEKSTSTSFQIGQRLDSPRLNLPWGRDEVFDSFWYGDSYVLTLPHSPVTDSSGNPASISDIQVSYDGTALVGSVISVDASSANVTLTDSTSYWDSTVGHSPVICDEIGFDYYYSSDGTVYSSSSDLLFGLAHWQMSHVPLVTGDGSGTLAGASDIGVYVDGTQITDAVRSVRPLFGHVTLYDTTQFWIDSELGRVPVLGDSLEFDYYAGSNYQYPTLLDDIERYLDYEDFLLDDTLNDSSGTASIPRANPVEIGYRFRTYLLHHTSVLNSPDTLKLNNYQKPATRASIANQQDALNHLNLFFSPEFLYDTSSNIVLDDQYLDNGLDPVLKLREGTPPFQKTFAYQPGLVHQRKLQDIRTHRHPLLYSDLLLKEFRDNGESVHLSSLCDSATPVFQFRYQEDIPKLKECDPWLVTDTVKYDEVTASIPGSRTGSPNLRVPSKKLRDNFILRETESTGLALISYEAQSEQETDTPVYYLPATMKLSSDQGVIDFPTLPLMKNETTYADAGDVTVKIGGTIIEGIISSIDPINGVIQLDMPSYLVFEHIVLTQEQADNGGVFLSNYLRRKTNVVLNIVNGTPQQDGYDFIVYGNELTWRGGSLAGLLGAGDEIEIIYEISPPVTFSYKIINTTTIDLIDPYYSRILDDDYVFASSCPDPIKIRIDAQYNEYVNYLDDYGSGTKVVYFNKTTYQIEEHVFSGPVFETYEESQDELSSPETFPNALVKVLNSSHSKDPLKYMADYSFMNDEVVRYRKKTYRELLPDRSYRVLKVTEMMPL